MSKLEEFGLLVVTTALFSIVGIVTVLWLALRKPKS